MSKIFYPKLASNNMKKNSKFYLPYILTCIFTIMFFYNMCSIASHQGLKQMSGAENIQLLMTLGSYVIGIFAVIFLFYTNNFLMRRRKKEVGLFNILGMEKRHIAKVLAFETIYTALISLVLGILCGIIFNKFIVLAMEKIIHLPVILETEVNASVILKTIILFAIIFLLCLLTNLAKISLSKPIELLQGQNVGEREPKTKWFLALVGFGSIGSGYYIALTTESPLTAIAYFFIAVILVIIGTYCLFTAGSIFVLKALRKNKKFYYKAKNFTSVSGMIFRMKQNAVGLANICILSTMVLVMVSGTVSLYIGLEDALDSTYSHDFIITKTRTANDLAMNDIVYDSVRNATRELDVEMMNEMDYTSLTVSAVYTDGAFLFTTDNYYDSSDAIGLVFTTLQDYNRLTNQTLELSDGEVFAYGGDEIKNFSIGNKEFIVKEKLSNFPFTDYYNNYVVNSYYIVVPEIETLQMIFEVQKEAYGIRASDIQYQVNFDTKGTNEEKKEIYYKIEEKLNPENETKEYGSLYVECKQEMRGTYLQMYGGFLFLGIFLGFLFIMATVLIIYYKQISEGYEDKERFSIMQKVGMSRAEVKKSIHSQVLMVFFLPIIMAGIHVLAAFKMITKLLSVLGLTNVPLFAICSVATVIVFAIIYAFVYAMTAKVYYKIVG